MVASVSGAGTRAILADTNPTLQTGYELVRGILRTKPVLNYPTARVVGAADSEFGSTWGNRAKLTAANENTTRANSLHMTHDATNTDWTAGAQGCPYRMRPGIVWDGRPLRIYALIYSDGGVAYEGAGVVVAKSGALGTFIKALVGYNQTPAAISFNPTNGSLYPYKTVTAGQRDAGIWICIEIASGDVLTGCRVDCYYNLTYSATRPAFSTFSKATTSGAFQFAVSFIPGDTLLIGEMIQSVGTGAPLGGVESLEIIQASEEANGAQAVFGGTQFAVSATRQSLVDAWDLGSASVTLSDADLRIALANLENTDPLDSGATWTFCASRGASAAAARTAAGTDPLVAATSAVWNGTGQFAAIRILATTTGATRGSLDKGDFGVGYAAV